MRDPVQIREIPSDQWREFLRVFSHAYRGEDVTIDTGRSGRVHRVNHQVPFRDLALRLRTHEADCVAIAFGAPQETEIVLRFAAPARLRVYVRPDGGYEALEMSDGAGETLWIRLPAHAVHLERRLRTSAR